MLGGMKLSRTAAALNILQVCREWTERVRWQVKGGMGLTRLVDSVRCAKRLGCRALSAVHYELLRGGVLP